MIEATATAAVAAPRYTRANPFPARLVVNRRLSGPESAKDTRHFELDLTGWGLSFEVGDSLAVYPSNDPQLVDEIVHTLGATGDEQVPRPRGTNGIARSVTARLQYHATHPALRAAGDFSCAYVEGTFCQTANTILRLTCGV
jgi:sulfite reductase alpha subunit-like flavoprotein